MVVGRVELSGVRHTRWTAGGACLVALSLFATSCGGDSGELAELKDQVAALEEKLDQATTTVAPTTSATATSTTSAPATTATTTTQATTTTTTTTTTTQATTTPPLEVKSLVEQTGIRGSRVLVPESWVYDYSDGGGSGARSWWTNPLDQREQVQISTGISRGMWFEVDGVEGSITPQFPEGSVVEEVKPAAFVYTLLEGDAVKAGVWRATLSATRDHYCCFIHAWILLREPNQQVVAAFTEHQLSQVETPTSTTTTTTQAPTTTTTTTTQPPATTTTTTTTQPPATTVQEPVRDTAVLPGSLSLEVKILWADWDLTGRWVWFPKENPVLELQWDDPENLQELNAFQSIEWVIEIKTGDTWTLYGKSNGWGRYSAGCTSNTLMRCERAKTISTLCNLDSGPCEGLSGSEIRETKRLEWGTSYTFRVGAVISDFPTDVVTITPMTYAETPSDIDRCLLSENVYQLNWETESLIDGGSPITGYKVQWGPESFYLTGLEIWEPWGEAVVPGPPITLTIDRDAEVNIATMTDYGLDGWAEAYIGPDWYGRADFNGDVLEDCPPND
jgi:hypothetical protein